MKSSAGDFYLKELLCFFSLLTVKGSLYFIYIEIFFCECYYIINEKQ